LDTKLHHTNTRATRIGRIQTNVSQTATFSLTVQDALGQHRDEEIVAFVVPSIAGEVYTLPPEIVDNRRRGEPILQKHAKGVTIDVLLGITHSLQARPTTTPVSGNPRLFVVASNYGVWLAGELTSACLSRLCATSKALITHKELDVALGRLFDLQSIGITVTKDDEK